MPGKEGRKRHLFPVLVGLEEDGTRVGKENEEEPTARRGSNLERGASSTRKKLIREGNLLFTPIKKPDAAKKV